MSCFPARSANPRIPFKGVRISWLIFEKKVFFSIAFFSIASALILCSTAAVSVLMAAIFTFLLRIKEKTAPMRNTTIRSVTAAAITMARAGMREMKV